MEDDLEFYSVMRTIRAIENSDVCILMCDAFEGFDAQDLNIFSLSARNRKGIVAGAGQVGASIALWLKAKRVGNTSLVNTIKGAVPAGILGIGEPLVYGVTLPLGKPFLTAGLGAGFGGAFVTLYQVAATTWGASGITGIFVMTGGPNGAVPGMLHYAIGLTISYIAGGIITYFFIKDENLRPTDSQ